MLDGISLSLVIVIVLALTFEFINGFHDTANAIATSVSTRVMAPTAAIFLTAFMNFLGALASDKVAKTIYKGLVHGSVAQYVIVAALVAAIIWNLITWYFGIPSSSSHALIGGLVGAALVYSMSLDKIIWSDGISGGVLGKVVLPLFLSPLFGLIAGFIIMSVLYKLFAAVSNIVVNRLFSKLQILSAAFMAYSHGNNDAQKTMGIITLALINAGILTQDSDVPWEVKLTCAVVIGLGTAVGGKRIIKTMGMGLTKLKPVSGFAAQTAAAMVIETATALGAPVSTTHVVSTAIMGVGSSKRVSAVRWGLAKDIVWAWVLTIPITVALGAGLTYLFQLFL